MVSSMTCSVFGSICVVARERQWCGREESAHPPSHRSDQPPPQPFGFVVELQLLCMPTESYGERAAGSACATPCEIAASLP